MGNMKIGDLVRFKDPNHPALYPYMKEVGIVMRWDCNNPVVFFPSVMKTFLKNVLEVISESL